MSAAGAFTEHEVQRGDWLYDIGRRHNVDLRSLLKANPNLINPDKLVVGIRIKIPQSSSSSVPPANARQFRLAATQFFPTQANNLTLSKAFVLLSRFLWKDRVHRVVEGDTLVWIAEKYGTTVTSLRKLNNLNNDMIYSGSVLKIDRAQRSNGFLGRKASYRERNALFEGVVETPMPVIGHKPANAIPNQNSLKIGGRKFKRTSLQTVKVHYGDTLADIACAHGLSIRELQRLNHLRDDVIFEGDVLAVTSAESEVGDIRSGRRRTSRPLFSRHTSSENGLPFGGPALTLKARVASGGIKLEGRWKRKQKGFHQPKDKWLQFNSPLTDGFISSSFGWRWGAFHEGVDLAADQGTPILASDRGTITFAGWSGGYGYLVAIQHEGGFVTRYAHCCAIHARVGQIVSRGQQVASVGATGHATGPHVHFEVRKNGEALDPFNWVNL